MSIWYSIYRVPDNWKLWDIMAVSYLETRILPMCSDIEFYTYMTYRRLHIDRLYEELDEQDCILDFTYDSSPDFDQIMTVLPLYGRLWKHQLKRAIEYVPDLKRFATIHKGKRYVCIPG